MASDISICTNALLMIGDKPIASFSESTPSAIRCSNLYPSVKAKVLRSHPWNCAIKRVVLSPLAETPEFDWGYKFTKPSDWLKTLQVGLKDCPDEYEPEGNSILANVAALRLRYIADQDERLFDSMLVSAMEMSMAVVLAYATTASTSLRAELVAELKDLMKEARAVDGQDDQSDELSSELILVGSRY